MPQKIFEGPVPRRSLESAQFLGFVIFNPQHDDYLRSFTDREGWSSMTWVPSPEQAYKFSSSQGAHMVVSQMRGKALEVWACFDYGSCVGVVQEY